MTQNKTAKMPFKIGFPEKKTVIGITGGVGAGKSHILKHILAHYGVTVVSADETGRELMAPGKAVFEALKAHYGNDILAADGTIDRARLSEIVFENPESEKEVNAIEHPLIRDEIIEKIRRAETKIVFLEAALLEEGDLVPLCDEVIYVQATEEERIKRLMAARAYTEEKCRKVMALQKSDAEFQRIATYVLKNNGDWKETEQSIRLFMDRLLHKGEEDAFSGNRERQ